MTNPILLATEETLPAMAGVILTEKPWKHDVDRDIYICRKCGIDFWNNGVPLKKPCNIPDLIPLTWPEAMKWRDWAVEKFRHTTWRKALATVYFKVVSDISISFDEWLCSHILSIHYIKAACLCAKKGDSDG